MNRYKLIALDMDGTVLNEQGRISEETQSTLREAEAAGLTVMFSTGRGMLGARPHIEEVGLHGPVITVNGSEIWATPDRLHKRTLMPTDWVLRMRRIAIDTDTWYWGYAVEGPCNRENWPELEHDHDWLKFGFYTDNEEKLGRIRRELEEWGVLEISNSNPCNLELNPKGISKASGLREVCQLLGIGMEQVVAMGDSLNDMAMIREAGLGIAMGNAQDELKAAADAVTLTNEEDGVAVAIRQHVLLSK